MLDSNTADDWKVVHTALMEKLEDWFNKEVHIPIAMQLTTVKEKSIATPHQAASAVREEVSPGLDHSVDFPSIYDIEDMDVLTNWTI